ncbi:MAG: pyrroline-5-carboxylate reductase [Acidimicrobiia bacterium]|nr:pyrroline-5-carboxylate reductase [Acidimicrobiia bacterium]MBP8179895.1 pyrroline-5-carboxylate reductase [Acidimicrobiia bacterium]
MNHIAIVGGGQMGEALLVGLAKKDDNSLSVVETSDGRRRYLTERFDGISVYGRLSELPELDNNSYVYLLAVKPHLLLTAIEALPERGRGCLVISVAAGVRTEAIESMLPDARVVRVMPNTPALVGAGASAISGGASATQDDVDLTERLMRVVGSAHVVPENQLDAVTGLSGSGPAYVFLFAEALIEGAVFEGLPRDVATQLAAQTLLGAARMLAESGSSPADLRAAVTSPGGTTARGLAELEKGAVRASVAGAVSAAAERSRQLG